MSDVDAIDGAEKSSEDPQIPIDYVAIAAAAFDVPIFTYVSYLVFEEIVTGAIVGVVVGLGTYLMLPYFAKLEESQSAEESALARGRREGGFHRGAAGITLSTAGIALFAWRFVSEDLLLGLAGVLVLVVGGYTALSFVLPRR